MSYLNKIKSKLEGGESDKTSDFQFKVTIIGDMGVGKTSIMSRYVTNDFSPIHRATIGVEFKLKRLIIDDTIVSLKLWDTCGEEKYNSITRQYYKNANGVLIVFDLTNPKSIEKLNQWLANVKDENDENIVVFLVGNKSDAKNKILQLSEEGRKFAESNSIPYSEVSAKTGSGITGLFDSIARKMVEVGKKLIGQNANNGKQKNLLIQHEKSYVKKEKDNKKCC